MRTLTIRLSDDLHSAARKAAGTQTLTSFVREAIAEKVGRSGLAADLEQLRERVERLEKQPNPRE